MTPTETPTPGVTPTTGVTPSVTVTISTSPTATVTTTSSSRFSGATPITTGTIEPGHNGDIWSTDCSHNRIGDSVGLNADGLVVATIERNLWMILGGSTLGTLCFYAVVYVLARRRSK